MVETTISIEGDRARRDAVERAVLMYKVDPARHAVAQVLARLVREGAHTGAEVAWADADAERRYLHVSVGAGRTVARVTLGRDVDRRVWTLGLATESPDRPEGYDLGWLFGSVAWCAEAPRLRLREGASPAEALMAVLSELVDQGWHARRDALFTAATLTRARAGELEDDTEAGHLRRVAEALLSGGVDAVGEPLIEYGVYLQALGRLDDSAHLCRFAYEAAIQTRDITMGALAARLAGRSLRTMSRWEEAFQWYAQAVDLAGFDDDLVCLALALNGTATAHADRGATPEARVLSARALQVALASGDGEAIGGSYQTAASLARLGGDLTAAASSAWQAAKAFEDPVQRAHSVVYLGSVMVDCGQLELAEQAYLGARQALEVGSSAWVLASDALAYVAALRGDAEEYERRYAIVEPLLGSSDPRDRAQLYYYRARALAALGHLRRAKAAHDESIAYARRHGFQGFAERSEIELAALPDPALSDAETPRIGEWLSELAAGV